MSGNLDNMPAEIVEKLLSDLGLGSLVSADDDWPIFVTSYPDGDDVDDNLIACYNTASSMQGRINFTGEFVEYHGIQIIVRAATEDVGYAKAKAILQGLDTNVLNTTVTISTATYNVQSMLRTGDVISLGPEQDNKRRRHSINYTIAVTQTT